MDGERTRFEVRDPGCSWQGAWTETGLVQAPEGDDELWEWLSRNGVRRPEQLMSRLGWSRDKAECALKRLCAGDGSLRWHPAGYVIFSDFR